MTEEIDSSLRDRFKIIKKMGSGAYGHVYKVEDRSDKKIKALKKNFDAFTNSTDAQRTYRQIMFLFQLQHPNIIKLNDVIKARNGKDIYLLFQYLDATLYEVSRAKNILTDKHRKYILYQVALALYHMHSAGLIHRDLKPANVMLNENCQVKLIDFGLVRSVEQQNEQENGQSVMTQYIATRWYRAPEIILGSKCYHKSIDIWSFGCLIAQTFTGKPLFPGNSTLNQIERVFKWSGTPSVSDLKSMKTNFGKQLIDLVSHLKPIDKYQFIPNVDEQCMDLINKALTINVQKRLSIQEVLVHPYFSEHFNLKDLIKSTTKIKLPIKDNNKLSLRQYRSLIYEQISKLNTKHYKKQRTRVESSIEHNSSFIQTKYLKSKSKQNSKHAFHNISHFSDPNTQQIRTIKQSNLPTKKTKKFFNDPDCWQGKFTRLASRDKVQRRKYIRQGSNIKHQNKSLVVSKPKRFSTDSGYTGYRKKPLYH